MADVFDYGCEESTNQPPKNEDETFLVSLPEHLLWISNCLASTYGLVNDIDLSGFSDMEPIGTNINPFRRTFKGGECAILNLDLNLKSNHYVGGIMGRIFGGSVRGSISGNVLKQVNGKDYVGGLVGNAVNATVTGNVVGVIRNKWKRIYRWIKRRSIGQ